MRRTTIAFCVAASPALAQEPVLLPFDGSFEDANFAVESTIVGRGLGVEFVSHVGDMLNRTGADVGSDKKIFDQANIYLFCSAVLSREVMEADPLNLQFCPYKIFITEIDGKVMIGHRSYPDGPMQKVEELLTDMVTEASEF